MSTTVINLYGGPGTGKSTSAAFIFYLLKAAGNNAELVREYVKEWAWDLRTPGTYDQLYLMGKQIRKESMLYGKVSHIVSDAPIMLGIYYARKYSPPAIAHGVTEAIVSYYKQAELDGNRHIHVFLRRSKAYNPAGRFQTEDESKEIDLAILDILDEFRFPVIGCHTTEEALRHFFDEFIEQKKELDDKTLVRSNVG